MKLRIRGNSIRLRLTKPEVDLFKLHGLVEDSINFGNTKLTYQLKVTDNSKDLTATYNQQVITVYMPEDMRKDWTTTEWVGYDAMQQINETESLKILVEKDFKCLDGTTEDQTDMYENPLSSNHP